MTMRRGYKQKGIGNQVTNKNGKRTFQPLIIPLPSPINGRRHSHCSIKTKPVLQQPDRVKKKKIILMYLLIQHQ